MLDRRSRETLDLLLLFAPLRRGGRSGSSHTARRNSGPLAALARIDLFQDDTKILLRKRGSRRATRAAINHTSPKGEPGTPRMSTRGAAFDARGIPEQW